MRRAQRKECGPDERVVGGEAPSPRTLSIANSHVVIEDRVYWRGQFAAQKVRRRCAIMWTKWTRTSTPLRATKVPDKRDPDTTYPGRQ
jgi:hypothetical protein